MKEGGNRSPDLLDVDGPESLQIENRRREHLRHAIDESGEPTDGYECNHDMTGGLVLV